LSESTAAALSSPPAACLSGVDFDFAEPARTVVLRGITLRIAPGHIVALVGPSGCGKTTLIRLLSGLLAPSAGTVEVNGQPPAVAATRGGLGILFQRPVLLPWRRVLDNIALPTELASRDRSRVTPEEALRAVGLSQMGQHYPHELSVGMQQRVALARALVGAPDLLLLDEPFSALDELARLEMAELLLSVQQRAGTAVLLVTHSLAEAVFLADRVLALSSSPCQVRHEQIIDLPHPRQRSVVDSPAFLHHVACVRKHVF
jgi:NitT/TauT family transport system ATP-binding protein